MLRLCGKILSVGCAHMRILKSILLIICAVLLVVLINTALCVNEGELVEGIISERNYEKQLEDKAEKELELQKEEEHKKELELKKYLIEPTYSFK